MSRGPITMTVLLFAVMAAAVGIIGIAAFFAAEDPDLALQIWASLLHILDPGTLAGNATDNLIILGCNDKLPLILNEYNQYVCPGTQVVIAADHFPEALSVSYPNLDLTLCDRPIDRALLSQLLEGKAGNILLLSDDKWDAEHADSQTLLWLILLRDIAEKTGRHFTITAEMRNEDNQRLAAQAHVDDFVIGTNFSNLLIAQISENPLITPLIDDLLDETGSELYMKPASNYVELGRPVDGYTLTESAARKGEVFIGYRLMGDSPSDVVINPEKSQTVLFREGDQLVVVAED